MAQLERRPGRLCTQAVLLLFVSLVAAPLTAFADDPPSEPDQPAPAEPAPEDPAEAAAPETEPPPVLEFHNEQLIQRANGNVVYFYRTNFVKPAQLITSVKALGLEATMTAMEEQNQVLIEGLPEVVEIILDAINYFDISTPQVFIETEVIEITWNSDFEFGLDWLWSRAEQGPNTFFQGGQSTLNPPSYLSSQFPPNFPFQGTSIDFGAFGGMADKFGLASAKVQALQINGKAEVLSRPSILATQGIPAKVVTEEQIPIARFDTATLTQKNFRYDNLSSGVTLNVTPIHIGDQFVTLKIQPIVKGLQGVAANRLAGAFAPVSTLREAETTVTLADGSTLVIGGLYTNTSTIEKAKTPILSDIPLIGDILTRTRETKRKTELVFLLTPRIVRKAADLKIIVPPSEIQRLRDAEEGEIEPACPEFKGPFGIRKPGAYLDELDD